MLVYTINRIIQLIPVVLILSVVVFGFVQALPGDVIDTLADEEMIEDPGIDLVDVCTPNNMHAEMSIGSLAAGKHVACEKPLAATLADAKRMKDAAARAKRRGVHSFVWFNYRRVPAVAFAHQLIRKGRLGRIFHVRACYLQDWGHGDTPLVWRFDASQAGSGAHGDLNAHIIDIRD